MTGYLNKEILRLAIPSILANITIPLVGMVSTGVAGHIPSNAGASAASFIAAMSLGSMLFNLLYWNFSFIRTGSGGLTAQAFGRGDMAECVRIFYRAVGIALLMAAVTILIQWPYAGLVLALTNAPEEVEALARQYFFVRIWAAPATISLMAFSGWFVGMQDSVSSMCKDLVVNAVNLSSGIILCLGIGNWSGIGFVGLAYATVMAQYSGLLFCIILCAVKYRKIFSLLPAFEIPSLFRWKKIRSFLSLNADLFVRSIGFIGIYIGYTVIAARYGALMLACSTIMMQLLMLFSYFTDGFAYAAEALTGRFIGARNENMLRKTIKYVFVWSIGVATLFIGVYLIASEPVLNLLTSDQEVVAACKEFVPWLLVMPVLGCVAFTWDGIYLGATASKPMRNSMIASSVVFILLWLTLEKLFDPSGSFAIHCLLLCYFAHVAYRAVHLSITYRRSIRV